MLERHMTHRFLKTLDHIEYGAITVCTPDGRTHAFAGRRPGATAYLDIRDWRMVSAITRHGDIGLAEAYREGWWETGDLIALFVFGLENQTVLDRYIYGGIWGRLAARVAYLFTRNTLGGSRKNIHAHYDLGNAFYALWLDPSMTYSSALYAGANDTLESAQHRKYDRIIDRLQPSGSLLEIGCGWGGFAERALQKGDYAVKGLTISEAQHDFATRRLSGAATIALEDYRLQKGRYDQIVSIEMFEAVGEAYWPGYFSKIKELLADKGRAMVQTITIDNAAFDRYSASGDAIRTFIFPGGMLPSPARFRAASEKAGLRIADDFAFGKDYARTLKEWLANFDLRLPEVKAMGFDDKFIRMWRFYLSCCAAAFHHGRTDVMQWELRHAA